MGLVSSFYGCLGGRIRFGGRLHEGVADRDGDGQPDYRDVDVTSSVAQLLEEQAMPSPSFCSERR